MADEISTLALKIDTSDVDKATATLGDFVRAGENAAAHSSIGLQIDTKAVDNAKLKLGSLAKDSVANINVKVDTKDVDRAETKIGELTQSAQGEQVDVKVKVDTSEVGQASKVLGQFTLEAATAEAQAKHLDDVLAAGGQTGGKQIDDYINKLKLQSAQMGQNATTQKLMELAANGATEAQAREARAVLETIDAYKQQEAAAAATQGIDNYISKLKQQAAELGISHDQQKLNALAAAGATDAQLAEARAVLETVEAYKKKGEAQSFLQGLQNHVNDVTGKSKSAIELLELKAAEHAVTAEAAPLIAALRAQDAGLKGVGLSAKQVAMQHQIAAIQVKDFFEQIVSGGSPLRAFAQQGAAVVSNYGGLGATFRALGSLISPTIVLFAGLAAAVGALTVAAVLGDSEQKHLQESLRLTGNFAGQTEDSVTSLNKTLAEAPGVTIGAAKEITQALLSTGRIGPEAFGSVARAASAMAKATGQSRDEIAKQLASMLDNVVKWAEATNKQYHFLTLAQYEYIRALQAQGREQEAAAVTASLYAERMEKVKAPLGLVARAWDEIKKAASGAWDAMLGLGKEETVGNRLKDIQAAIAEAERRLEVQQSKGPNNAPQVAAYQARVDALKATRDALVADSEEREKLAKTDAAKQASEEKAIYHASAEFQQALSANELAGVHERIALREQERTQTQLKMQQMFESGQLTAEHYIELEYNMRRSALNDQLKLIDAEVRAAKRVPVTNEHETLEREARVTEALSKRHKVMEDMAKLVDAHAHGEDRPALLKDNLGVDIDKLKRASQDVLEVVRNEQSELDAFHQAGLITEEQYYAERLRLMQRSNASEIELLELENKTNQEFLDKFSGSAKERLEMQRAIQENEDKIRHLRASEASNEVVLEIQRQGALNNTRKAYEDARISAEQYLNTLALQHQRELAGFGQGDDERRRLAGRNQISDRYTDQRQALEKNRQLAILQGSFNSEAEKQYKDQLALIDDFQGKALSEWDNYFKLLKDKEHDGFNGFKDALADISDQAGFTAKNVYSVTTDAFKGMEDSIVNFVTTGKLSFKSMIDSFVAGIVRLIVQEQAIKPISDYLKNSSGGGGDSGAGWLGSLIGIIAGAAGGGSGATGVVSSGAATGVPGYASNAGISGGRAVGGPVTAGRMYEVNELARQRKEPELLNVGGKQLLLMGNQSGNVSANDGGNLTPVDKRPTSVVHVTNNFHVAGNLTEMSQVQAAERAGRAVRTATQRVG